MRKSGDSASKCGRDTSACARSATPLHAKRWRPMPWRYRRRPNGFCVRSAKHAGPTAARNTADPSRPWDRAGSDDQTVTAQVEAQFDEVRLLLLANKPEEAFRAAKNVGHILTSAIYRQREAKKRAARQERQKRKAVRDREELERERRRIERQLKALAKTTAR